MDTATIKNIAIEKLVELPKEEIAKVLIFMAGLDAGMRLSDKKPAKQSDRK